MGTASRTATASPVSALRESATAVVPSAPVPVAAAAAPVEPVEPVEPGARGRTSIADPVVGKIAGLAAREIDGVHAFGGSLTRALGAVRDRIPGGRPSAGRGVKVEVGERQTAIDLDVVFEYGVAIADVASDVRDNVISTVERMTGLEVVEVNINVVDIHIPGEDDGTDTRVE